MEVVEAAEVVVVVVVVVVGYPPCTIYVVDAGAGCATATGVGPVVPVLSVSKPLN